MSNNDKAAADGKTSAPKSKDEAPLQMQCKVLENGMIYGEAMHSKGKIMAIDEKKANALANMTPPKVEILGVL
jgi:hypothetical protein